MFATIRRHQKWFWGAIIAVIIPSFVIFFTPDATLRGFGSSYDFGSINGRPIPQDEYAEAYREAEMYYYFQSGGTWPSGDDTSISSQARTRCMLIRRLQEQHIQASEEATVQWITNAFYDRRQNVFHPQTYDQFVKKILAEHRIGERDFERFVSHQVGIQELVSAFGLNGALVTPLEAASRYKREHEQLETEAAVFSATNYLASVVITTNALGQFYTNRSANYRVPERVQVSYVKFDRTNCFAEADQELAKKTNLTQELNAYYLQQGPNSFLDTNGSVLSETAAKAQLKQRVREQFATLAALKKANEFAVQLYALKPAKAENLARLAKTNQLAVRVTEPFNNYEGPSDLKVGPNFAKAAFLLNEEDPFPSPLQGEDAVYVIAFNRRLPSDLPSLQSLQAKVTEDYRRFQALNFARAEGESFYAKLTNGLAQGKTFAAVCQEAKVKPEAIPKFSLSTRDLPRLDDRLDLGQLRDAASGLTAGKVSPFTPSRDGGFVLGLRARLPADEAEMKRELPAYTKTLQRERIAYAFNDWLNKEMTLARLLPPKERAKEKAPQKK